MAKKALEDVLARDSADVEAMFENAKKNSAVAEKNDEGAEILVTRISDRGAENRSRNPLLQIWTDLNTQALAYWRDLGLTPAGLKKIDEQAMKQKKESALAKALRDLA